MNINTEKLNIAIQALEDLKETIPSSEHFNKEDMEQVKVNGEFNKLIDNLKEIANIKIKGVHDET